MRAKLAAVVAGALIGMMAVAPTAMASGGSAAGGNGGSAPGGAGGGGGGGATPPAGGVGGGTKTEPCVRVNSSSASGSQSSVTANAALSEAISVSTCGGSAKGGFTVTLTAVDPTGTVVLLDTSTWTPVGSTPYVRSAHTDNAAYATTYQVAMRVVNTETGVTDATASTTASTPTARTPGCAAMASLSGREGLIGTMNALWAFYTLTNCGPADMLDVTVTGTGTGGSVVISTTSIMFGASSTINAAHDFDPAPVDTYTLTVTVVDHSTGEVLATATSAV